MKSVLTIVANLTIAAMFAGFVAAHSGPASPQACPDQGVSKIPGEPVIGQPVSCGEEQCPPSVAITWTYECDLVSPGDKCSLGEDVLLFEYIYWKCENGCAKKLIDRKGRANTTKSCALPE